MSAARRVSVSPARYRQITAVAAVAVGFIIVTGGAVRLTGSGLGCPDWPTCARGHLVAPASFHPLVEFANRVVTGAVSLAVALAVAAALIRTPRRRDLTLLSLGLVAGVLGQIVLGGLTVLYRLEPPFVMAHFLLSMVLLADAVVLDHRAGIDRVDRGRGRDRWASPELIGLGRLLVGLAAATLVAGTVVTSSGPHGGDAHAPRWDFSLHRVTQIHGGAAMLLLALALTFAALLRANRAPVSCQIRARQLLEALAAQVALGYAQYFTGVPALLVGFHIGGAALVWTAVLRLHLGLSLPDPPHAAAPAVDAPGTADLVRS